MPSYCNCWEENMRFNGPFFAILTPFDQSMDIDFGALKVQLEFLAEHRVENIIVGGTTGEFASLTIKERKEILEFCRKNFNGKIVNHISSTCLLESTELIEHSVGKADAILLLPPYYYANISEEGVLTFLSKCLEKSTLPAFLYNFPRHTQINIDSEWVRKLITKHDNLIGIKDSGGDIENSLEYKKLNLEFQVYVGSDTTIFEVLKQGLNGTVTGAGVPVPEYILRIHNDFANQQWESAQRIQNIFNVWNKFRKSLNFNEIAIAKAALSKRIDGFPIWVRPPLIKVGDVEIKEIGQKLHNEILPITKFD